ncbi:MAG: hypothetical protein H7125_10670 [Proteobacteria bacterium]|nr:hypothetical protein [Burkholderiales bacterium]
MSDEAQRNVNRVEWMWLLMLFGNVITALFVMWVGPTNLDESFERHATLALLLGAAFAVPTIFVYQKWNQLRYRSPRPDPESDTDLQSAQVWMTTGAMVSSLPMYVGIGFFMFTGNSSVLMILTGISLGILLNFRPAPLFAAT